MAALRTARGTRSVRKSVCNVSTRLSRLNGVHIDHANPGIDNDFSDEHFVAFAGHKLAGSVQVSELTSEDAYVHTLFVCREFRRRGIGRALMLAVIDFAIAHGELYSLDIEHHPENAAARRLYKGLGFESVGESCGGERHRMSLTLRDDDGTLVYRPATEGD